MGSLLVSENYFIFRVLLQTADMLDIILYPATVLATFIKNNTTSMESVPLAFPLSFSLQIHNTEFDFLDNCPVICSSK
jgi:hypothetical protein